MRPVPRQEGSPPSTSGFSSTAEDCAISQLTRSTRAGARPQDLKTSRSQPTSTAGQPPRPGGRLQELSPLQHPPAPEHRHSSQDPDEPQSHRAPLKHGTWGHSGIKSTCGHPLCDSTQTNIPRCKWVFKTKADGVMQLVIPITGIQLWSKACY